jgi:hypothetical protein
MTKTFAMLAAIACMLITTANAGWLYLVPDFSWFGYLDGRGVPHQFQADAARYDQRSRDYQVQIRGHWLRVGRDVFRLTDLN